MINDIYIGGGGGDYFIAIPAYPGKGEKCLWGKNGSMTPAVHALLH